MRNTKDHFTSFDRAQLQISGGAQPIESILLKYDFLIVLPTLSKPQNYSISVRVVSRLAVERHMREEAYSAFSIPRFIRMMAHYTGSSEITYVDYAVARSLSTAIDEWFQTIPRSHENKFMKWAQKYTHWLPRTSRFITGIVMVWVLIRILPYVINETRGDFLHFARFFLYGGLAIYAAYMIAGWLGIYAEGAMDSWSTLSYIKINRGDEREVERSVNENRTHLIKGAAGLTGVVIMDVIAKVIAEIAVIYF
jgi:hypothetical protein